MDSANPSISVRARRAVVVGSIAFGVFWVISPTAVNDGLPWIVTLGVHGLSIAGLVYGLGTYAFAVIGDPRARTILVGLAATIVGLLTLFPLIPIGLAVVGIGLLIVGLGRVAATLLLAGSTGLLAAYASGARVGMESAPPMSSAEIAWFQVSVALTAAGLIALGHRERLPARHHEATSV